MRRENVTFDWLIATDARGFMCGSSATDHPSTTASFTRAHERAGHTVTRLSFQDARARLAACRAPARERYYAPREATAIQAAETVALPAIGDEVQLPLSQGRVIAHLRWPDHHPTHAGRVAALVRGVGFEGLAYPGQAWPSRPPSPEPRTEPLPPAAQPVFVQPSLF